jgi:hypothetical protein
MNLTDWNALFPLGVVRATPLALVLARWHGQRIEAVHICPATHTRTVLTSFQDGNHVYIDNIRTEPC